MMTEKQIQIVVLGAGYAGLMAAIRLAGKTKKRPVKVILVNASDRFVERPRLHETATGNQPRQKPLADLIAGTGIEFRQGYVAAFDPDRRQVTVETADGNELLPYDYLVYALGSRVDRTAVPGVVEHAYALDAAGPLSAGPLQSRLQELALTGGRVTVVGSGPTGIEAAAEIADLYPTLGVTIVTQGEFGAFKNERVQRYMRGAMRRLNISLVEGASVREVREDELIIANGRTIPLEVAIWAGGFRALPLARQAGLQVNGRDQILVDPCFRSLTQPNIYVAGDAAWPVHQPGAPLRMALFPALVTGAHVADNLSRMIHSQEQRPLGFSYYGQGIALGRHDAVGFATFPKDDPIGPLLTGRLVLVVRNCIVWLMLFLLAVERRRPGFFFWLGGRRGRERAGPRRRRFPIPTTSSRSTYD
ncbi:MAG: FAD-dependent oxidoreductase [Chloroflexota bacterium]|nr:MAG: FAD-dependent oxidoreductase [Chloroflexota bacterium]